jgi:hypothetical protein
LLSRVAQQLVELGQFLPNKYDHSRDLRREQERIGYISAYMPPLFGFINQ